MLDRDYFAAKACSQSFVKKLLVSPKDAKYSEDNPTPPGEALQFGSLVDALMFTPQLVNDLWLPLPSKPAKPDLSDIRNPKTGEPYKVPAGSAEGKARLAPWLEACEAWETECAIIAAGAGDRRALTPDQWTAALDAAIPVANAALDCPHPRYRLTLRDMLALRSAQTQLAILYTDTETGCPCKAKLDAVITLPDGAIIGIDGKTTRDKLTTGGLSKTVSVFGYHIQAASYWDALAQQGVALSEFWFVFVCKTAPYEAAWIQLDGAALVQGAKEWRAGKEIYAQCVKDNIWPSAQQCGLLGDTVSLPRWYKGVGDGE